VNNRPWDFDEAREAARVASHTQQAAEEAMREAARDFAVAEEKYRVALAKKIVELHDDGVAWSACADLARGDTVVAQLRRQRDISEGVREACVHAAWRRAADRKDTQRFIDYSFRREFAETGPEPEWTPSLVRDAS